jgi:hypothetical protein
MPVQTFTSLRAAGTSGAYFRRAVLMRVALFLALTVPLVWLMVGAERSQLSAIAREQSNLDVQNLAHAFSEEVNATIGTVDLSVLHLRAEWNGDPARFQALVEGLNRELHDRVLLQVAVTDARGRLVFSTAGPARGMDVSDREQIRFHLDGHGDELFVSRPVQGRVSGMWAVHFTRPVYGKDGKLRGVIMVAENILEQLNREFVAGGQVLHISGSIGYALFPADGLDGEALMRSADRAMYAAKSAGRGCVRGAEEHERALA